jgi:hypothetical protein
MLRARAGTPSGSSQASGSAARTPSRIRSRSRGSRDGRSRRTLALPARACAAPRRCIRRGQPAAPRRRGTQAAWNARQGGASSRPRSIWRDRQPPERSERKGRLTERQQPRNVGKRRRLARNRILTQFEPRKAEHRCSRTRNAVAEVDVDATDMTHCAEPVGAHDTPCELFLQRDRLGRREVPVIG